MTHLMLIIFSSSSLSMESLDNAIHLHPLESFHFLVFHFNHHFTIFRSIHTVCSHRYLTRHEEISAARYSHCTYASHHCLKRLPERSELKSNLTESHQMAQQGSLKWSTFHLHKQQGFHRTGPVLVPHRLAWYPEHSVDLHPTSLQLTVQAQHSVPMRLVLDDQFVPLPLRRSPSFVVLQAQHGHNMQGLSACAYA